MNGSRRRLAIRLLGGSAAIAAVGYALLGGPPAGAVSAPGITREQEIVNAQDWLTADNGGPVPYSQASDWSDGYRQDCSGYASMALGLPPAGPNTVELVNDGWTVPVSMGQLRQGDLVINDHGDSDQRHVVIFDHWTDGTDQSYMAYEQAGSVGTEYDQESYGVDGTDGYQAYEPVNLTD
jgi:hypothetical protein